MSFLSNIFSAFGVSRGPYSAKTTAKEVIEECGAEQYLKGKTAIVTGGNSGIGLEGCKALASAGCHVIMCSRSVAAGEKAIEEEMMKDGEGGYSLTREQRQLVSVKQLDLNSMASIKTFTDTIISEKDMDIDYLICNAGIMAVQSREETADGFEKQCGVNHFGHAYLVDNLYDKITTSAKKRKADVRIVVLASSAHTMGSVKVDDLHYTVGQGRSYSAWGSYGQSKLCNILFAKGLEEKLRDDGHGDHVTAMSVHPGVIKTPLWRNTALAEGGNRILEWFGDTFLMKKTIPQGASTTLFAALAPIAKGDDFRGAYCVDCGKQVPSAAARNVELARALWKTTYDQLKQKANALK